MADITVLPKVWALDLLDLYAPGVPNEERIYLKAIVDTRLGEYFIFPGWRITDDLAIPFKNDLFWFGNLTVAAGTWVIIYTGPGETKFTTLTNGEPALVLHWGKPETIFALPQIVPVLIHVDAVRVGTQRRL